jgi:hypothetical protein
LLEGFYDWITCAETNISAAIRKHPLQGARLTLALAMAHEHLRRFVRPATWDVRPPVRMSARHGWARSTLLLGGSRTMASWLWKPIRPTWLRF